MTKEELLEAVYQDLKAMDESALESTNDFIQTFEMIRFQHAFKNREISDLAHHLVDELKIEKRELENAIRDSKASNTDKAAITWHPQRT